MLRQRVLLGDQPRGLRGDPVEGRRRRRRGRPRRCGSTRRDLLRLGIVDGVVPEPAERRAHRSRRPRATSLRIAVAALRARAVRTVEPARLRSGQRSERFRGFGHGRRDRLGRRASGGDATLTLSRQSSRRARSGRCAGGPVCQRRGAAASGAGRVNARSLRGHGRADVAVDIEWPSAQPRRRAGRRPADAATAEAGGSGSRGAAAGDGPATRTRRAAPMVGTFYRCAGARRDAVRRGRATSSTPGQQRGDRRGDEADEPGRGGPRAGRIVEVLAATASRSSSASR